MVRKTNIIPLAVQAENLKHSFPGSTYIIEKQILIWRYKISPSPMGDTYSIKVNYQLSKNSNSKRPRQLIISITDPLPLKKAVGKNSLEHCYNQTKQELCLFYGNEWNNSMLISNTVVPWIYDWLYHYEIWVGTGVWNGGGIHPRIPKGKIK